jgi:hypothetical protein
VAPEVRLDDNLAATPASSFKPWVSPAARACAVPQSSYASSSTAFSAP